MLAGGRAPSHAPAPGAISIPKPVPGDACEARATGPAEGTQRDRYDTTDAGSDQSLCTCVRSLSPEALCQRVAEAGDFALGQLELLTAPAAFPLRLMRVPQTVAPRGLGTPKEQPQPGTALDLNNPALTPPSSAPLISPAVPTPSDTRPAVDTQPKPIGSPLDSPGEVLPVEYPAT